MKRYIAIFFLTSLFTHLALGQTANPAQPKERERWPDGTFKWTTTDSVSMTEYTPIPSVADSLRFYPSPDGKYFFLLAYRGDLSGCKCTYRTLYVYETRAVREWLASSDAAYPTPFRTLQRSTKRSESAISVDPWWDGNGAIVFTSRDAKDDIQVFRLDVASGKLRQITNEKGIKQFSMDAESGAFRDGAGVFFRGYSWVKEPAAPMIEPAPRNSTGDVFVGYPVGTSEGGVISPEGKVWTLPGGLAGIGPAWVAPGGARAVMVLNDWGPGESFPNRFVMVDIRGQKVTKIADVATRAKVTGMVAFMNVAKRSQALWTSDGSEVIAVNVALPAKDAPDGLDKNAAYLAAYEPSTGRWRVLDEIKDAKEGDETIKSIGWLTDGKELLVAREKDGKPTGGTVYSRQGDKWVGRPVDGTVQLPGPKSGSERLGGLNIFIKQGMNDPQVLMASDGTREKAMAPPDPALKNVGITRKRPFEFAMPDGSKLTVGLTLPLEFQPGSRLPLVIQNSAFRSDKFLPDGQIPSGLARQALAAQGFAVLDIGGLGGLKTGPMTEGPGFVARIDAVVDALAREGIVDPARVGLVGHSRAGWLTHYAATHPGKIKLVAAEVWDSTTNDYISYLRSMVTSYGLTSDNVTTNGGPFWGNKENWMKHDVRFNADRVEAAMLFVDMIAGSYMARFVKDLAAPTIAALQANRRPFDYLFLNGPGHTIAGAPQRKAAMDLTVDWMNFWIQGREDPDPAKAEQYKRWWRIREKNEQRKAEEAKTAKAPAPAPTPTPQTPAQTQTPGGPAQITSPAADQSPDEAAIKRVKQELKDAGIPEPQNIFPLNVMAYREMYVEKDMAKAEKLFRWNLILFPNRRGTSMITDSMAEYYLQAGDIGKAIEYYTRSLALGPNFPSKAKQIIQRLKADPASLGAIQEELRQDYINFTKSNPGE
jgi:dipeptidyl aminopeptidase/acylaminoacyl peptidase